MYYGQEEWTALSELYGDNKMEKLITLLNDIRPDLDFNKEEKLIDNGILDSFDIITIIGEIDEAFNIEIKVNDILPENFNSAKLIWELIQRYMSK